MPDDRNVIGIQDQPITHFYGNTLIAIKAWVVDSHPLAGEQPADRQRIKASLPEPLLLTLHSDTVLSRDIGKRRNGFDQVTVGMQPQRRSSTQQVV